MLEVFDEDFGDPNEFLGQVRGEQRRSFFLLRFQNVLSISIYALNRARHHEPSQASDSATYRDHVATTRFGEGLEKGSGVNTREFVVGT